MAIHIDPGKLSSCAEKLEALAGEAENAKSALSASRGLTKDQDYTFAKHLATLAMQDFPQLCRSSADLLRAIRLSFEQADSVTY